MKNICNPPIFKSSIPQPLNLPMMIFETLYCRSDSLTVLTSLQAGQWVLLAVETRRFTERLACLVDFIQRTNSISASRIITPGIQGDSVKPGVKTTFTSKRVKINKRPHECVLDNVVHDAGAFDPVLNRGCQPSLISMDKLCVSSLIT